MRRVWITAALLLAVCTPRGSDAQPGVAEGLVGSWTLAGVERGIASGEATRVPGPHGLLVIDSVGHVFEFFGTGSRDEPQSPQLDWPRTFADFGGFWGHYEVAGAGRIDFEAEAGVSPNVLGLAFSRAFELDGDRLVMTSTNEPQAQADTRWTWQRVPTAEMTPTYREVVGFWQHIDERRVNVTTGEVESIRERGPSVIVYTPAGYFGVHFPVPDRKPFAGDTPTVDEAQAAFRGYIGYFGALGVYPGEVAHNVLAGVQPSAGSILRRFAEVTGDEAVLTLPSGRVSDTGAQFVTKVYMHRLSGLEEMLPR
jgi:Lipocalin-like domain